LIDQIPFKSQNRFSAVRLRDRDAERILVLGAPEVLDRKASCPEVVKRLQQQGLRVLLMSEVPHERVAGVSLAGGALPDPLEFLALIALEDELRPEAGRVLQAL